MSWKFFRRLFKAKIVLMTFGPCATWRLRKNWKYFFATHRENYWAKRFSLHEFFKCKKILTFKFFTHVTSLTISQKSQQRDSSRTVLFIHENTKDAAYVFKNHSCGSKGGYMCGVKRKKIWTWCVGKCLLHVLKIMIRDELRRRSLKIIFTLVNPSNW